jgi:hypothetical protein
MQIFPGWDVVGNANGGYLLSLAVRAMREAAGRPDPVTTTAHFLAPGRPGPATVTTEVVKRGRTFTTVTGSMDATGRRLLQVLGTFGDVSTPMGPERVEAAPPDLPSPDACVAVEPTDTFPPPFMGRVDLRLHPDDAGFASGAPSGELCVRGWFRLRDGEPIDTIGLVLAVDAFPPTAFNARLPLAWTPTVELTAHVRARPAPGWLRCSSRRSSSPEASWRRTARSGTTPAASSPKVANWHSFLAADGAPRPHDPSPGRRM